MDHYEFDEELSKRAFVEARKIYKERGFMRKMGFGKAPVVITVDMAKAWMSEGHPFTYDHSEEIYANVLRVLEAGRKTGIPIFHTTTGYVGKQQWDLPRWNEKISTSALDINPEWLEIDPKLKPLPEESVIHKKCASSLLGTHLVQTLNLLGVDTLIVMSATSCACIRHTVMDFAGYGFKTIIPESIVDDRVPGVIEWNLFDMEAKFADVVSVDEAVEHLEGVDSNAHTKYERSMDQ